MSPETILRAWGGVPTLFEEDSAPLTEHQATTVVEILASVREELPEEPFVALSVLRAQERDDSQFACIRDFGSIYLDKYHLEYAFHHCGNGAIAQVIIACQF